MIIALADMLIFIAITFVGDHSVGFVQSFLMVWIALILYRQITGLKLKENELRLQQYLLLIFLPYLLYGIFKSDSYYYAFLQTILYINAFPILLRFMNNNKTIHLVTVFFIILTTVVFFNSGGSRLGSNSVFIFGPNIMYRIYGVLFFIFYYVIVDNKLEVNKQLLFVFILSFICLISTGSRGGTIVFLMEFIAVAYYFRKETLLRLFILFSTAILVYVFIQYWELISSVLGRAVYFDATADSENTRLSMLDDFFHFIDYESLQPMLFGLGNNNHYYSELYPHNIIIEFIVYHGLLFFWFISLCLLYMINKMRTNKDIRSLAFVYSPIAFGAMVSGYYLDNFTIISLIFYSFLGLVGTSSLNNHPNAK